jgi:hypothetical protein
MVVWRIPLPRTIVSEADVHAVGSIIARHEPPEVGVVVPPWLHEDVVDAFDDAVPVHPDIVSVAIGPVPVDPDSVGTGSDGLLHGNGRWRWWCRLGGGSGLGFLNDDYRLAIDFLGLAALRFDDRIVVRIDGLILLAFSYVAIMGNVELASAAGAVTVRPPIVRRGRIGEGGRRTECKQSHRPNEQIHSASSICTSNPPCRHPPRADPDRAPRQRAEKVLGFWRL